MRADRLRRYIDLHSWVGIVAGLALFVAFFAGAVNMFHDRIGVWQAADQGAGGDLQTLLDGFLRDHPDAGAAPLYLVTGQRPSILWYNAAAGAWQHRYAAGDGDGGAHSDLADFIDELHYQLAIPDVGLYLMGLVSVLYGAALISGLMIHWPRLRREFFALRHQGNTRRYWKNLHNLIGVISFPFHLIFAVTGAVLCGSAVLSLVLGALVFGAPMQGAVDQATRAWPAPQASGQRVAMAGIDDYLSVARQRVPGLEVQWLGLQRYGDKNAVIDVAGVVPGAVAHHAHVVLRGDDGTVLRVIRPGHRSFNQAVLSPLYALHFGDYGGAPVRWLYFGLGLLGALLFVSGNLLWCERRTDRRGPSRSAALMLRLTLGVTLGVVAGIAMAFLASKLVLHSPLAVAVADAEKGAFLVTLGLAMLTALRLPPLVTVGAWLRLSALLYLAVPLLQAALEGWSSWTSPAVLAVNLEMFSLALALALVDGLRRRRLRRAAPHPLWTLPIRAEARKPGLGSMR